MVVFMDAAGVEGMGRGPVLPVPPSWSRGTVRFSHRKAPMLCDESAQPLRKSVAATGPAKGIFAPYLMCRRVQPGLTP